MKPIFWFLSHIWIYILLNKIGSECFSPKHYNNQNKHLAQPTVIESPQFKPPINNIWHILWFFSCRPHHNSIMNVYIHHFVLKDADSRYNRYTHSISRPKLSRGTRGEGRGAHDLVRGEEVETMRFWKCREHSQIWENSLRGQRRRGKTWIQKQLLNLETGPSPSSVASRRSG